MDQDNDTRHLCADLDQELNRLLVHALPDVLTHNYHPSRGAFRNICHLAPDDAEKTIATIRAESGSYRKPDYLDRRLQTETWLIAERIRKLGRTPLSRPIYFFVGDMADGWDTSRPESIIVPLSAFDPGVLTFTYPDSMTSCPQPSCHDRVDHACHGQVYTLSEIEDVVRRYGVPDPRRPRMMRGPDAFIEVQAWDDRPLARFRSRTAHDARP